MKICFPLMASSDLYISASPQQEGGPDNKFIDNLLFNKFTKVLLAVHHLLPSIDSTQVIIAFTTRLLVLHCIHFLASLALVPNPRSALGPLGNLIWHSYLS
jgi:hypothetical protein